MDYTAESTDFSVDDGLGEEIFQLPVSGHYDCGYSYGNKKKDEIPILPPKNPLRKHRTVVSRAFSFDTVSESFSTTQFEPPTRPVSPPITLPNSFTAAPRSEVDYAAHRPDGEADSDRSSLSSRGHFSTFSFSDGAGANSFPSPATSRASSTREVRKSRRIEPDPLPSHSNPQQLTPTQLAAYSGPRPVWLSQYKVCDCYSGEVVYEIAVQTKLKMSGQIIHQVHEPGNPRSIGTLGFGADSNDVAAIYRGKDISLRRETPTSARWLFRPSAVPSLLARKSAHWYWMRDRNGNRTDNRSIVLTDAKKNGSVIARINRDVLSFEKSGLAQETVIEITFAAMALAELVRKRGQSDQIPQTDIATHIATVAMGESLERTGAANSATDRRARVRRTLTFNLR